LSLFAGAASAQTNKLESTGNAGVGTTTPESILTVQTTGGDTGGEKYLRIKNTTSFTGLLLDPNQSGDAKWLLMGGYPNVGDFTIREMNVADYFTIKKTTGNLGIGTTTPGQRLNVIGNGLFGNITTHTSLYSTFDSQQNQFLEIGYGTSHSAITPFPALILSNNTTSTSNAEGIIGQIGFANRSIADGNDKRTALITSWVDGASNSGTLQFYTSSGGTLAERFRINSAGKIGIGNVNPVVSLDIKGDNVSYGGQIRIAAADYSQITFYNSNDLALGANGRRGSLYYALAINKLDLNNNVSGAPIVLQDPLDSGGGNVGIGVLPNANYKLDVAGNINSSATITGNNIVAKYQDVAEWVPSTQQLAPGTVVVLDASRANEVIASSQSYDTRVAGVVSAQPGITLGEAGQGKALVATTGRVRVKVDASRAPINIGDLLVTSDLSGVAMKSEAVNLGGVQIHRPGTIIGKALEPLAKGQGEILVLLSLQ
jgi:hypothetical protein